MLLDNYLEPERILSYNECRIITKKEYAILKRIAKQEKEKIENEVCLGEDGSYINNKIIENRITSTEYSNLSTVKKEVMLANAILPDDTKIIDALSEHGFTLEHIKALIRSREIIKKLLIYNLDITDEIREEINKYKEIVKTIISIFREKFQVTNSTIILNRICELLATIPELFETKNNFKKLSR